MAVLAGRVAVVTGASVGIGAGLAAMLAAECAKVVLASRWETELAGVADGIRQRGGVAIPVVTDLTSDESIARLLATAQAEAGPVDVLVNNAGYAVWKPLEETASAEWDVILKGHHRRLQSVHIPHFAQLAQPVLSIMLKKDQTADSHDQH